MPMTYDLAAGNTRFEVESDIPLENVIKALEYVAPKCGWLPPKVRVRVAHDFEGAALEETRKYNPKETVTVEAYQESLQRISDSAASIIHTPCFPILVAGMGLENESQNFIRGRLAHELNHVRQEQLGYTDRIKQTGRWMLGSLAIPGFNEGNLIDAFLGLMDASCDMLAIEDFRAEMAAYRIEVLGIVEDQLQNNAQGKQEPHRFLHGLRTNHASFHRQQRRRGCQKICRACLRGLYEAAADRHPRKAWHGVQAVQEPAGRSSNETDIHGSVRCRGDGGLRGQPFHRPRERNRLEDVLRSRQPHHQPFYPQAIAGMLDAAELP